MVLCCPAALLPGREDLHRCGRMQGPPHARLARSLLCYTARMSDSQPSPPTAQVVHLFLKPQRGAPMQPQHQLRLEVDGGIAGDAAYGRSRRQVLLVSTQSLQAFGLRPGDLRENITVQGMDVDSLDPGTRLAIGQAILELTVPCHPCDRMEHLQIGLRERIRGRRGVLARVIESGVVRLGDPVTLLDPA